MSPPSARTTFVLQPRDPWVCTAEVVGRYGPERKGGCEFTPKCSGVSVPKLVLPGTLGLVLGEWPAVSMKLFLASSCSKRSKHQFPQILATVGVATRAVSQTGQAEAARGRSRGVTRSLFSEERQVALTLPRGFSPGDGERGYEV